VQAARVVGIAKVHSVVEVEQQTRHTATEPLQLPPGQQAALDDDGVIMLKVRAEAEVAPERSRQGEKVKAVASRFQMRAERREPVAAADVIGTFNQDGQMHATVLPDRAEQVNW
jgi:hypothetical protein